MSSISSEDIISILKEEIENYDFDSRDKEVGKVIYVGDGIVTVYGIDNAMYGEIVVFENGVKGMVQDIRRTEIGCILFGRDTGIKEGTKVSRTGKRAGIPVGDAFIGRIVDALGAPIDGKGSIESTDYRPIENPAPSIVDRKSVNQPLQTGILSIDAMFPIGRGQRELIIGDRQTGKTSIAIDTILNQKGKDVICVYVAIGQKASTIAKVVNNLNKYDAMDYTIVVASTASDSAPLQYIAPYSGTAIAEYFMHKGKDVLICQSTLLLTEHCHCFSDVHQDVRHILEMYSISIQDFLRDQVSLRMSWAEAPSQPFLLSRHRQAMYLLIYLQMLYLSQMDRYSSRAICSSQV